jgi:branched-chain amino acid transport system ATP-binding protein
VGETEQPTLEVSGLTVRFGGVVALDRVSLQIAPGEVMGIIGPNGAGKTTLFNAICGFVRPETGRISYRGQALLGTAPSRLARLGITRTLQGLGLWPGLTVLENVVAGSTARPGPVSSLLALPAAEKLERRIADEARAILRELGLEGLAQSHPRDLPYGVQKRVIIARALMAAPSLLLLDEPASGLATKEIDGLAALVRRLRDRMSIAIVEHNLDLVMAISDHVTVLDFGDVIASGTPEEIRQNPKVTSAYLGEAVVDEGEPAGA